MKHGVFAGLALLVVSLLGGCAGEQQAGLMPSDSHRGVSVEARRDVTVSDGALGDVVVGTLQGGQAAAASCLVEKAQTNAGFDGSAIKVRAGDLAGYAPVTDFPERPRNRQPMFNLGLSVLRDRLPSCEPPQHQRRLMKVSPASAQPGQQVALHFPEQTLRGVGYVLDGRIDDTWQRQFYLTSDGGRLGWTPGWWSVDDAEGRGVPDVGVGGPGPDHVVIPDSISAGTYRICADGAAEKACAFLTVTE